jgi:VWFA-related protein
LFAQAPRVTFLFATFLLSSVAVCAQQQPSSSAGTLRVTSRIVILDVDVYNRKTHQLVNNLSQGDFTILEDNAEQTIRSFDPPSSHAMPTQPTAIVRSSADLPNIGNAPVSILVFDELNTAFEDMSFSSSQLIKYLQAQPVILHQPTTLLIATNTRFTQLHDYTQNRDELIAAVKNRPAEVPWKLANGRAGAGTVERMAQTLAAVDQIAQASAGTPGRKNIIWVGVGFLNSDLVGLDNKTADTIQGAVRQTTNMLLTSRATFYIIDPVPNGTTTVNVESPDDIHMAAGILGNDPFESTVTFFNFAPQTGGRVFFSRNDLHNEIAQAIDVSNNYYTFSYTPSSTSTDEAKYRHIKIKLSNPDLIATTRDGYYPDAFTNSTRQPGTSIASQGSSTMSSKEQQHQERAQIQLDLQNAILGTMTYNGLTVTATKAPPTGADSAAYTVVVASVPNPSNNLSWRSGAAADTETTEASVLAAWYDAKGKLLGHAGRELTATRPNTDAQSPATFTLPVAVVPNTKRLRFIVRDAATGRMGTVDLTTF